MKRTVMSIQKRTGMSEVEIINKVKELIQTKQVKSVKQAFIKLGIPPSTGRDMVKRHGYNGSKELYREAITGFSKSVIKNSSTDNNTARTANVQYDEIEIIEKLKELIENKEVTSLTEAASKLGMSTYILKDIINRNNFDASLLFSKSYQEEVKRDRRLKRLEFEAKQYKKKYEELLRQTTPIENIIEELKENIVKYEDVNIEYLQEKNKYNNKLEEELVLLLSDTHIGERVNLENIIHDSQYVLNTYDLEVFKERMQKLYDGVLSIKRRYESDEFHYKTLNIFMLGDMISGIIHDELLKNGGLPVADQVIEGALVISEFIYKLAHHFENINVVSVVGNHGRMDKKVSFKNKYNNFDYFLYKFVEVKLSNVSNINFVVPKSPFYIVQIYDYNFLLRHGDGKSQSFAGIPMYGIMRTSAKATQMFASINEIENLYIHYEVLGHYHTPMSLPKPGGKIIVNGSLKGTDEFSLNNFLSSAPSQKILVVNKKRGVFANVDIFCD